MKQRIVGVIPMAGSGKRPKPLPFSKELYPIGVWETQIENEIQTRPKVVAQYLIDGFRSAGITQIYIILGPDKDDVIKYFGSGHRMGVEISYIYLEESIGMPFTIDSVYPWLSEQDIVVFGMADTIICPPDIFKNLRDDFIKKGPDLILGAFKTSEPWKFGMIDVNSQLQVTSVVDKPKETDLEYMWGNACWSNRFFKFMHNYLIKDQPSNKEVVFSDVIKAAIDEKFSVHALCFEEGSYIDIGTIDGLLTAIERYS